MRQTTPGCNRPSRAGEGEPRRRGDHRPSRSRVRSDCSPYAGTGPDAPTRDPKTLEPAGINTGKPPGFKDFLTTLRTETIAFRKPVAYVHGDTHYFRVDEPLLDATGRRLENFTRVETFGDNAANGLNDAHWVKALVDPQSRDVFAFQAQIVPANRVAVPSP